MDSKTREIKEQIKDKAAELGFSAVGFSKAEILHKESARLSKWLSLGYDADMKWISKGFDKRKNLTLVLKEAKSVISLAFNYFTPVEHDPSKPKISRYAWGKDYHKILKAKLKELCLFITQTTPSPHLIKEGATSFLFNKAELHDAPMVRAEGVFCKYYIDDGPVMDKAWAVKSGIGWMGKHTNVISPKFGSWFFIGTIITDIEFDTYDTPIDDMCGSCSLCVSACPTGAIVNEYVLESNKCISYQTIENRGEIPPEIDLDGWVFGCDVCQDVCPYNSPKYNMITQEPGFYPKEELFIEGVWKSKAELETISEDEFKTMFSDSPIKRTKYSGWMRNLDRNNENAGS